MIEAPHCEQRGISDRKDFLSILICSLTPKQATGNALAKAVQIVADSSTLILLAKCSLLEILCGLVKIIIPKSVVDEVASRNSIEILGKIGRYSPEIIADALISLMEIKNGKADNHKDI